MAGASAAQGDVQLWWPSLHGESLGNWQCHSCALSLTLGLCSGTPPGSKREIFGVGSAPQVADVPPPASPAGPKHLLSCLEALTGSETLFLLAAAFMCPCGQTWAS